MARGDAGRDDDELRAPEVGFVVAAVDELRALDRLGVSALIGARHDRSGLEREPSRGDAALSHPDDEHAMAGEIRHRTFSVESATSASMIEMIQNRTMIFGSLQPFFS